MEEDKKESIYFSYSVSCNRFLYFNHRRHCVIVVCLITRCRITSKGSVNGIEMSSSAISFSWCKRARCELFVSCLFWHAMLWSPDFVPWIGSPASCILVETSDPTVEKMDFWDVSFDAAYGEQGYLKLFKWCRTCMWCGYAEDWNDQDKTGQCRNRGGV